MKRPLKFSALIIAGLCAIVPTLWILRLDKFSSHQAYSEQVVAIGTGAVSGLYFAAGGTICRLMNKSLQERTGFRCLVEPTAGSVENIELLLSGRIEFGIVQSDVNYRAYKGLGSFADQGANPDLRSVFSIHPEPFTVVARADAGIANFEDLAGKRVNIGNPGSGQRDTMEVLMAAMGWTNETFALASELKAAEQSQALCDNNIDAMVYTVGHPSASIGNATTGCDSVLVNVSGAAVDQLVADNPYYRVATIPGGMYRGNDADTPTFGVAATLMTSASVPDHQVYQLVKSAIRNIDAFRQSHLGFADLDPKKMANDSLSAPLHPGAERYFREAGLID